jgi:tRNA threonylcarbamoyladenosine biosynthesis protein TsaE
MTAEFLSTPMENDPATGRPSLTMGPMLNLAHMESFAQTLARALHAGDLVALEGPMGSGKTTLTRLLGNALGAEAEPSSPTFALQRVIPLHPRHKWGPTTLVHYDLYRIDDPRELDQLGFGMEDEDALVIVEWPERCPGLFQRATIGIRITVDADDNRHLTLHASQERLNTLRGGQ